jgi:choline dehydrogenase-like flavoprotein
MNKKYDYVIVGSGAGGSTLARELSRRNKSVLVLEAGEKVFPPPFTPAMSKEGIAIFEVFGVGGATTLCNGNAVRASEKDLAERGIHLESEYRELETELKVAPIALSLLTPEGGLKLLELFNTPGTRFERMPKLIDPLKCEDCGRCSSGCEYGAKWDVRTFLDDALAAGAELACRTRVEKVIIERGRAVGVEAIGPGGRQAYHADAVVLAAGGLRTPIILQHSGFAKAGQKLFIDTCELWLGVTPEIDISAEPPMQLVHLEHLLTDGFIATTAYTQSEERLRFYCGDKADLFLQNKWMGVLIKIQDEAVGRIFPDGTVSKGVTPRDREKLDKGARLAREMLLRAGAKPETIVKAPTLYGGHNGASAAIGEIVDTDLKTEVDNLFVCDASVLPHAPALPPVLTILALARHLGRQLA